MVEYSDRTKARRAIDLLGEQADVLSTVLVSPDDDPTGCWTIEAIVDCYGIPPQMLRPLADYDLVIRDAGPHADHYQLIASVL